MSNSRSTSPLGIEELEQRSLLSATTLPILPHPPSDVGADVRALERRIDRYDHQADALVKDIIHDIDTHGDVKADLRKLHRLTVDLDRDVDARLRDIRHDAPKLERGELWGVRFLTDRLVQRVDHLEKDVAWDLEVRKDAGATKEAKHDLYAISHAIDGYEKMIDYGVKDILSDLCHKQV